LASSAALRASETWLPICFPKFNPAGFVHAYISYVLEDVGLVFVSADREAFEDLQQWKAIVLEVSYTLQASCLSVRNWKRIKHCRRFRNLYLFIRILLVSVPSAGLGFVLI
jgi:hypothetical protein